MPELGKWNGMDQLSEMYYSTNPYAYVANNPVSNTDPDGRWIYEDGSIGQAPATWAMHGPKYKSYLSYSMSDGMTTNGGGGDGYTFTGNAASSVFSYFANGGNINGISFADGWAKFWTSSPNSYDEAGNFVEGVGNLNMWRMTSYGDDKMKRKNLHKNRFQNGAKNRCFDDDFLEQEMKSLYQNLEEDLEMFSEFEFTDFQIEDFNLNFDFTFDVDFNLDIDVDFDFNGIKAFELTEH